MVITLRLTHCTSLLHKSHAEYAWRPKAYNTAYTLLPFYLPTTNWGVVLRTSSSSSSAAMDFFFIHSFFLLPFLFLFFLFLLPSLFHTALEPR